ncbi:NAD(+) diphosphatase [Tessaracoccus defluvii]|uniref:NAD(+) diphosphatase n=1 Tax=Tessaracoccus defluvii TaxID=1285901 RepID=UPI0031D2E605
MNRWQDPSSLARAPLARTAEALDAAWGRAAVVEADAGGNFTGRGGHPVPLSDPGPRRPEDILVGEADGRAWFVRLVPEVADGLSWRTGDPAQGDVLAAVVALARWHGQRPRCEACGGETVIDLAGARRVCVSCEALAFPRTDPCVIVAITDREDRLLLARQATWPIGRHSIIAGFIEAGESAEQACHREVAEEVGVALTSLRYVVSQPWPMPRSLMLGFEASTEDTRIQVDGNEIVAGEFFSRADLAAAVSASEVTLPGTTSIARHLIDAWFSRR